MKKILVVDDEHDIREILEEFFKLKGYNVKSAENGEAGLKLFYDFAPDLALVDLLMPIMNGFEFTKTVLKKYPDFPIIIITAYSKEYNREDILDLGVREIINKPLQLNKLSELVEKNI
jgi:CheY-like chemotaxis protein